MRTVGTYLKEERLKKKLSLSQVQKETKIKRKFIEMIENCEWKGLPGYSVTLGFVRTIAKSLDISEETAAALFRRDCPRNEKDILVNPKPDVALKNSINPKMATIFSIILAVALFLGYLFYQYLSYISPPTLSVLYPSQGQESPIGEIQVRGNTDAGASLSVNNQAVLVDDNGLFSDMIEIDENTQEIVFIAKSRYGKETVVIVNIKPKEK